MRTNECDVKLVDFMLLTCCSLCNLCKSHEEDNASEWDSPAAAAAAAAAEPVGELSQGLEEEEGEDRKDLQEGLTWKTRLLFSLCT